MVNFKLDKNFLASFSATIILACIGIMTASTPITATYALGTTIVSSLYILSAIGAYHSIGWLRGNAPQTFGKFFKSLFQKPEVKPEPDDSPITAFENDPLEPDSPMQSEEEDDSFDLASAPASPVQLPDSPVPLFLVPPLALPLPMAPVLLPTAPISLPVEPVLVAAPSAVMPAAPDALPAAVLPAIVPRPPVLPLFLCNISGFSNKGSIPRYIPYIARRSARLLGF